MEIKLNSIEAFAIKIAKYAKNCGVKNILETKPALIKNINSTELRLRQLPKDTFIPKIGKHKIPKFLYHLTPEINYLSMLEDGKLRMGDEFQTTIKGVYMLELNNLFKHWGKSKDWMNFELRKELLEQVGKAQIKIVALRIPTKNLDKSLLKIRSQNKCYSAITKNENEFEEVKNKFIENQKIPTGTFEHFFTGDKAINSKLYKQRKEAIEYIYQQNIDISNIQKIGSVELNTDTNTRLIYSELFKGTPEEKALVTFKD